MVAKMAFGVWPVLMPSFTMSAMVGLVGGKEVTLSSGIRDLLVRFVCQTLSQSSLNGKWTMGVRVEYAVAMKLSIAEIERRFSARATHATLSFTVRNAPLRKAGYLP